MKFKVSKLDNKYWYATRSKFDLKSKINYIYNSEYRANLFKDSLNFISACLEVCPSLNKEIGIA